MKVRNILISFILFSIIFIPTVNAKEPEITATSAAVIDCIDGKILYSKNMEEKLYPASLTNVLTAILVVENCNMQDTVTISQSAIDNVQSGYLTAKIQEGEILTVEQLLNLLLISSYNDVANALAEHVGGTTEEFVEMMNKKAKEIGCTNSNFVNCNGTHDENQYSTAHDMALIGKYAMQYDEIKEITGNIYYELGATNVYEKTDRLYQTTNEMILSGSKNYYRYASGIKTGFTTPAGYCVMIYSVKNDIPLVSVVMKSTTSDSRYEDSKKILEYAYENNTIKTIAKAGTNLQTVNIKNASQDTKKLNVLLENDVIAVVNVENEENTIEPKIQINDKLKAPIEAGEVIGTVSYEIEGKTYTANLIAENKVEKSKVGTTFIFIFIGLVIIFGTLRTIGIYKRTKTLKKIRNITKNK